MAVADSRAALVRNRCAELARLQHGLVGERAGHTVMLLPDPADLSGLEGVATVGVSSPAARPSALPEAYRDARRCLAALLALGHRNTVGDASRLGVFRFILSPGGPDEAARLIADTIGSLLDYDRARGTRLATTLEVYLASGRHHAATAEALHIHPNTLYQRLGRIREVLGDDWNEPDRALQIQLALRLRRILDAGIA